MEYSSKLYVQDIFISPLKRWRTVRIMLPAAYFRYPDKKFPVMYMLDGQNLFDASTAFAAPWGLKERMDRLPLADQCILVGIDNGGGFRGSEYLPNHRHKMFRHGEGDQFLLFIKDELIPKGNQHLRTHSDRHNTMICGSSMGGLLSFYAATRMPEVFGKAGVMSPAFWLYPQVLKLPDKPVRSKIYVMGSVTESRGMRHTLEKTYHVLKNNGYTDEMIKVEIKERGKHNEILWGREFTPMLKWLMHIPDHERK